jgi:hypothetical protein
MSAPQNVVTHRARRLSILVWVLVFLPLTMLSVALAFAGTVIGDTDVRFAWFGVPLSALLGLLSYKFMKNLIWLPTLEISREGLSWVNFDTADGRYGWEEIEGPRLKKVQLRNEISFLAFTVKSTGREVELPLIDMGGATYDEVEADISSARRGDKSGGERGEMAGR